MFHSGVFAKKKKTNERSENEKKIAQTRKATKKRKKNCNYRSERENSMHAHSREYNYIIFFVVFFPIYHVWVVSKYESCTISE